jgi:CBS domain containing-hemolysin-like protein
MQEVQTVQFILLGALLGFSFFFSATETAFFSLSRLEREALSRKASPFQRKLIQRLLAAPDEMLITILTGNMIVNVLASSLGEVMGQRIFPFEAELFSIVSMTLILLLVGEMTPKILAVRFSLHFARAASTPIYFVHRVLAPVRWLLNRVSSSITVLYPGQLHHPRQRVGALILSAIKLGLKRGILNPSEEHLFRSFFSFRDKTADEVKIPRSQLKGVADSVTVTELIELVERQPVTVNGSYIIAFQKDMDHLVGYLQCRQLLPYKYGLKAEERLGSLLRPFHIVPESKDLTELMLEMGESNAELALVVDEYGGTAGVITFQHLIEEILGYFYPYEREAVTEIEPNRYALPGSLEVEQLEELFGVDIESESRTAAGLIIEQLGEIPDTGPRVTVSGLEFTIKKISRSRILEVEVRLAEPS